MASLNDLTPRELEILQLVIAGKTNKEIAHEVFISKKTVEFHLDNIYSKIGARTRVDEESLISWIETLRSQRLS